MGFCVTGLRDLYSVIFGGAYTWSFGILRYSVAFFFLDVQCTIMIILSEHSWGVSLVKPPKRKAKDK